MEKQIKYFCASHICSQVKIIELKEILKDNKNRLFDEVVSKEKLEKQIKDLEEMHYCDKCPNREKCLNYYKGRIENEI